MSQKEKYKMENVNHPLHYQKEGRKECIVEMRERFGENTVATFCLTNAYKYLYRAGDKDGNSKEQDIAKAKWYFNYFINELDIDKYNLDIFELYTIIKAKLESEE